jgi:hypothetical protein
VEKPRAERESSLLGEEPLVELAPVQEDSPTRSLLMEWDLPTRDELPDSLGAAAQVVSCRWDVEPR